MTNNDYEMITENQLYELGFKKSSQKSEGVRFDEDDECYVIRGKNLICVNKSITKLAYECFMSDIPTIDKLKALVKMRRESNGKPFEIDEDRLISLGFKKRNDEFSFSDRWYELKMKGFKAFSVCVTDSKRVSVHAQSFAFASPKNNVELYTAIEFFKDSEFLYG